MLLLEAIELAPQHPGVYYLLFVVMSHEKVRPVTSLSFLNKFVKKTKFLAMGFGLPTAPQVFNRLMTPVSQFCHKRDIRLLRYLEDGLVLSRLPQEAMEVKEFIIDSC